MLKFIPLSSIKKILKIYFQNELRTLLDLEQWAHPDLEREALRKIETPIYDGKITEEEFIAGLPETTGVSFMDRISWKQFHDIVIKLSEKAVPVSGVRYPGRYVYVLAVWCGQEDPAAEHNAVYPDVKFKHIEAALRAFIKELQVFL